MVEYRENGRFIHVLLEGKRVGDILSVEGGYAYFPKGSKTGGKVYSSIQLVKRSLEE